MNIIINVFHILANIIYIYILSNVIQKANLINFYIIVIITCIGSVFLHELSHIVFAKIKKYDVVYIRIFGLKINFFESKVTFDPSSVLVGGQVNIDYASKIVDKRTKDSTLRDLRNNFIVGAIITGIVFGAATIIFAFNVMNIVAACVSWINCNMLLSSCKKDSTIQDLYGYFNFDNLEEEITFIIFFQAISSERISKYLYDNIMLNLLTKLDSHTMLRKHDLNALIIVESKKSKFEKEIILHKVMNDYSYLKYDNFILYYLYLCIIIINNWNQYDLKEVYSFIKEQKDFINIIKIPVIGYRYIYYEMLFTIGESTQRCSKWKYWDESRLGLNKQ